MLILASSSKTRADILKNVGVEFRQVGVDFDEDALCVKSPKSFVYEATCGKMARYLELHGAGGEILCAEIGRAHV